MPAERDGTNIALSKGKFSFFGRPDQTRHKKGRLKVWVERQLFGVLIEKLNICLVCALGVALYLHSIHIYPLHGG